VSRDSTQWVKEIITTFLEEYPFLQNEPMTVSWKKMDKAKGYAVGSLSVIGAQVPVIIKEWMMAPLDIMMFPGGITIPLSDATLKEVLTSPTPFKGIERVSGKSNLLIFGDGMNSLQHSPTDELSAGTTGSADSSTVRDAIKVGSFIDRIENIDVDVVKEILMEVKNNPEAKANFEKNGTYVVLEKLAKAAKFSKNSEIESFVRGLEVDRQMIYTDAHGNYHVKQANSAVDYAWDVPIAPEEANNWSDKVAKCEKKRKTAKKMPKMANAYEIMGKEGHFYMNSDRNWHIFSDDTIKESVENVKIAGSEPKIGDTGVWRIGNKVTKPFEIIGIEKSAEFELANVYKIASRPGALYINTEGEWMVDDKNIVKTANSFEPDGANPVVGDFGVWVVGDYASTPFEIVGMHKSAEVGGWEIVGFDGLQKHSYYPIRPDSENLIRHELKTNTYYVPGNAKFVKLGQNMVKKGQLGARIGRNMTGATEKGVLMVHAFDGLNKVAYYVTREEGDNITTHEEYKGAYYVPSNADFVKIGEALTVSFDVLPAVIQTHIVYKDDAGLIRLEGPEFDKYGETHDIDNLTDLDAKWILIHMGADSEDIKKVASLAKNEQFRVNSSVNSPTTPTKIIEVIQNNFEKEAAFIRNLTRTLVKEAAVIKDEDTIDAILSLGLIKRHNVAEYVALIPDYSRILGELAKLLLMTRLGMTQMPEEIIKRAMDSMLEVVEILRGIEASIKKG
jgi:hypothetical protein